jgi:integrase
MPRLVHKIPRYSHHKARNLGKVRHRGKDHYFPGPYNSPESLKAYAEWIDRLIGQKGATEAPEAADVPATDDPAPSCLTIAELVEKYWDHVLSWYRRDGELTGEHAVIRAALRPLLDMFSAILVSEFKPRLLKAVREEMIRRGWSRRYINASVRRTKQMFNWAVEEELVPSEVAGALAMVRGLQKDRTAAREKPEVGPVADEVIAATLARIRSKVVPDMIRVMRLSGMRPGEALRINVEEIDRSNPECWQYKPKLHKTSHLEKPRVIFLGPKCQAILAPWIVKTGSGRIFRITKSGLKKAIETGCDRAYPHHTLSAIPEAKLTPAQLAELKAWRKAHRWHPNQLRHAAATEFRREHGLEAAQVLLGHSKADTTQIYAEASIERGREVALKIG